MRTEEDWKELQNEADKWARLYHGLIERMRKTMRLRDEIKDEIGHSIGEQEYGDTFDYGPYLLEVLLDIRDLLMKEEE